MKKIRITFPLLLITVFGIQAQSNPISGNGYHLYGPNSTWGQYLKVGGNGRETTNASVVSTNGNLHLDSKDGRATYLNYYSKGNTYLSPLGGNVGIGTTSPSARLHVVGDGIRSERFSVSGINDRTNNSPWYGMGRSDFTGLSYEGTKSSVQLAGYYGLLMKSAGGYIGLHQSGNVGIGTNNPSEKLQVNGSIRISRASGTDNNSPGFTCNSDDDFSYNNNYLHQYGMGFHAGHNGNKLHTYLSGHWGLNFFTGSKNRMFIDVSGKVGIGTTSPKDYFQVGNSGITLHDGGHKVIGFAHAPSGNTDLDTNLHAAEIRLDPVNGSFSFGLSANKTDGPSTRMFIRNNGNVGIGTTNPGTWKLAVNGKIRAKEIKVETGWADYVFEDSYDLPTLTEVEQHIQQKGHLINIPSAADVAENGIYLGEMNAKLLEKIEELTLYTIAQEKEIETQQKAIEMQSKKIIELESQISKIKKLEHQLETLLKKSK